MEASDDRQRGVFSGELKYRLAAHAKANGRSDYFWINVRQRGERSMQSCPVSINITAERSSQSDRVAEIGNRFSIEIGHKREIAKFSQALRLGFDRSGHIHDRGKDHYCGARFPGWPR